MMYLVRLIENKEIVGIYTGNLENVGDAVDELTDPYACEYISISNGGFHWAGHNKVIDWDFFQKMEDDDEDDVELFPDTAGMSCTEAVQEALETKKWKPLGPHYAEFFQKNIVAPALRSVQKRSVQK